MHTYSSYECIVIFRGYLVPTSWLCCSKGLHARQAEYAVRKYHAHRRIGAGMMTDVG
ncbi:hypothetical protein BYT27DRAFT_7197561 [Phlegmacium glaucopus]|nr:hypothetical protein BYT27DRAFT_7197561 [Phlegmacium glaucopus]